MHVISGQLVGFNKILFIRICLVIIISENRINLGLVLSVMSTSKELQTRQMIGRFVELNPNCKPSEVAAHFARQGVPKSTTYRVVKRIKSGFGVDRKPGSGQHLAIDHKKKERIVKYSVNKVGDSYCFIGRKFGVNHVTVKSILAKAGVKRKNRRKCPEVKDNQLAKQKKCLNKLRKTLFKPSNNVDIILDDESYFTTDGSDTNENNFYYSSEDVEAPESVRFRPVAKFPKKALVWVAMSSKGFSEPYVVPSGNAVTADVYIRECLTRLKDFIDKHHSDGNYVFWPDLASAHYAQKTTDVMRAVEIKFVDKSVNPPNVPQIRPIERFWAILQKKIYSNGWSTDSVPILIRRIKSLIRKTPENLAQNLMRGLKTKVRKAADRGPLSVIN